MVVTHHSEVSLKMGFSWGGGKFCLQTHRRHRWQGEGGLFLIINTLRGCLFSAIFSEILQKKKQTGNVQGTGHKFTVKDVSLQALWFYLKDTRACAADTLSAQASLLFTDSAHFSLQISLSTEIALLGQILGCRVSSAYRCTVSGNIWCFF